MDHLKRVREIRIIYILLFRGYTDFLEDLEEDPDVRADINIYKGEEKLMCF